MSERWTQRGWGHVVFHGGIPSPKRPELVDKFRNDPDCRLFLSTDAGGVGLNLQHAGVVVNVDLPWNPAVLEQRIARVHRLGQKQRVQIFDFVAQGTIEEGMLNVLTFKKSLFAGVLDGGEQQVFLGGTQLQKFMDTVDAVTEQIPVPAGESASEAVAESEASEPDAPKAPASNEQIMQQMFAQCAEVFQQLAGSTQASNSRGNLLRIDPETGEQYLHLPVPSPEVLGQLLQAMTAALTPPTDRQP